MVFKDEKLRSIRDVDDVAVLLNAKRTALRFCESFALTRNDMALFFHYRPSYFRLHMHIVSIASTCEFLGSPFRNVFLDDAIKNIERNRRYYKDACHIVTPEM